MRKVVTSAPFAPESPAFVFVYPVGTATGFSPVTANVTAGAGSLTVFAKDGTAPATPGLNDATTLDRYWTLTETGAITADLTFQYLNTDVDGNEANYRMIRSNGTSAVSFPNACPGSPCVTPAADTIFAAGVQSFDNHWTAGEPVAPTASSASVSGQVFDSNGRGSYGSFVSITDSRGNVKIAITNPFGYFSFTGLQTGQSYVISVRDKRRQYESRVINLTDDAIGVDFMPVN
jgi:hypothetical protein